MLRRRRAASTTLTSEMRARLAFMRFGLGPKPGSIASLSGPNAALNACMNEIEDPQAAIIPENTLIYSQAGRPNLTLTYSTIRQRVMNPLRDGHSFEKPNAWDIMKVERMARLKRCVEADVGFLERLVLFWVNHFSVDSVKHTLISGTVGHMERTAIRPHVLGKFSDMLKAVIAHPAMLLYLDNDRSYGPESRLGKRYRQTYNENLAREILELHTVGLGPDPAIMDGARSPRRPPYTQNDVINLAKIITGWTFVRSGVGAGQFHFDPDMHEPGPITLMRRNYAEGNQAKGNAALEMLANHPSTANHIAFKLLQHFVTDKPTANAVNRLAGVFLRTGGDLKAVSKELLQSPEAWSPRMVRIRQPYSWLVSVIRGMIPRDTHYAHLDTMMDELLSALNHQIWKRVTPDGYPDENRFWENSNAIRVRIDALSHLIMNNSLWTDQLKDIDVEPRANSLLPGILSQSTKNQIAASVRYPAIQEHLRNHQALTVLFASPEYLRS